MEIRAAVVADAPALGSVMVDSWLSAHRGQVPDAAWRKRVDEWTPDVSARGWARVLADRAGGGAPYDVLLVAEDHSGALRGLAYGTRADSDPSDAAAELMSLYVVPDHQRRGVGMALLRAVATEMSALGFSTLRVSVLTVNAPARRFYETTGAHEIGRGTVDEEGHLLPVTVYEWSDLAALVTP